MNNHDKQIASYPYRDASRLRRAIFWVAYVIGMAGFLLVVWKVVAFFAKAVF